jgi:uncharacterized protein YdaU (DUF1376 family)
MKVRRVDYSPDEFFAGVAGKMTPAEVGIYWMVCTLIYSKGGPIDYDPEWLARTFKTGTKPSHVKAVVDGLIAGGKLTSDGVHLGNNRASSELQRAVNRVATAHENGTKGGRPLRKINGVAKPGGLFSEKLTINHQPSTTNQQHDAAFAAWWKLYPRKEGKGQAERAYMAALKRPEVTPDVLLDRMTAWAATQAGKDPKYIPHASTWLNGRRWEDDQPPPSGGGAPAPNPERAAKFKAYMAAVDKAVRECIGTTDPRFPKRADFGLEER